MDPEVRAEFDEIRSLLHAMSVRETEIERRADRKHEQAMARMDKWERKHGDALARMDRADARQEKFERGVRKLLVIGAKELVKLRQETRELKQAQKAFFQAFLNGRTSGNGQKR
jgi:hypothetical protein